MKNWLLGYPTCTPLSSWITQSVAEKTRPAGPWSLFPSWEGYLFPGDLSGKSFRWNLWVPKSFFGKHTQVEFCWTLGIEALPSQQIWNPCLSSGLYTGGLGTFTILSSKKWIHTPMTGGLIHWQLDQIFYSLGIKFWSVNLIIWKWRRWSSRALFGHKKLSGRVTTRSERICPKIGYPTSSSQSSPHPFITSWQFSADSTATSSGSPSCSFIAERVYALLDADIGNMGTHPSYGHQWEKWWDTIAFF